MNRNVLTSTLHILCNIQMLFLISKFLWLTVETKMNQTNKTFFFQTTCRFISDFAPIDGCSQTHCLEMLFHLIIFLRQFVTIFGELAQPETTFTDKLSNPLNKYFKLIHSVCEMRKND